MLNFSRTVCIRFSSADPAVILSKLSLSGVFLRNVKSIDLLTIEIWLGHKQYELAMEILLEAGLDPILIRKKGLAWRYISLLKRPVFMFGIILYLILAILIPQRILFVQISGNVKVPTKEILYYAQECGVRFGSRSAVVRSENVKNQLLAKLPELQWIGINTKGCVAMIHVIESSDTSVIPQDAESISSIVASKEGVISHITVKVGTPLCAVGQSVNKGDVLVSGYTDCGIKMIAQNAEAEVFAHTNRVIDCITVRPVAKRGELIREHTCYKLKLGKKVINLCNHSGIPDTSCVKMYSEDCCLLPGAFTLPISVLKQRYLLFETDEIDEFSVEDNLWLSAYARQYTQSQMVSGEILSEPGFPPAATILFAT